MYLEFDENFPDHPKSVRLCSALQHPVAWAYMAKLWCWARKYQKDGDLTGYEPSEIEFAIGWTLADGKFYAAAVRAGFIDEERDSSGTVTARRLHNWMKRSGGAIKRMEDEATRKRTFRLHNQKKCDAASCPHCPTAAEVAAFEAGQDEAEFRAAVAEAEMSAGRPADVATDKPKASADGADQDKTKQGKSKQDLPLPFRGDPDQTRPESTGRANGPLTGLSVRQIFSEVRSRMVGGLPWQVPRVAEGKDATMAEIINADPAARADVAPTIELLFKLAKAGAAGDKSQQILDDGSFAFGTWCSKWTALRERVHGKARVAAAQPGAPALPTTVDMRR